MKNTKLLSLALSAAFAVCAVSPVTALVSQAEEDSAVSLGDADGDGTVTIQDATLIQRYLAEFGDADLTRIYYPESFYAADVNSNGKIDIGDVTALQRMLAA